MTLLVDNRATLDGPGLHALVCGVSPYPHLPGGGGTPAPDDLGLGQLSSPAISAFRLAEWLREAGGLAVPLATLRLLASPSEAEVERAPALGGVRSPCTFAGFRAAAAEWRRDAEQDPAAATLLYVAAHQVERIKGDSVVLCEDFGDGIGGTLANAFGTRDVFTGMAPSPARPAIARTQMYFVDACRVRPEAFARYEDMPTGSLWDLDLGGRDDRRAAVFFAAAPGALAYGVPGEPTVFGQALRAALDGGAAELEQHDRDGPRWCVSFWSLGRWLAQQIPLISADAPVRQLYRSDGMGENGIIRVLDGPPPVRIDVRIDPE